MGSRAVRFHRHVLSCSLSVALAGLPAALAAVALEVPAGWRSPPLPEARDRAAVLATRVGGKVVAVASTAEPDDFVETIAVVEVDRPLPGGPLESDAEARALLETHAAAIVPGGTVQSVERRPTPDAKVRYVDARLASDTVAAHVAVVPLGQRTAWVAAWSSAAEAPLYRRAAETTIRAITAEASAPISPFSGRRARWIAWLGWLLAAAGVYALSLAFSDRKGDHLDASGRAMKVLAAATVLVFAASAAYLASQAERVVLSGTTPWLLALHLALPGAVATSLAFAATRVLASGGRIASAPPEAALPQLYRPNAKPAPGPEAPPDEPVPAGAPDEPAAPSGEPPEATLTDAHEAPHAPAVAAVPTAVVVDRTPVPKEVVGPTYHLEPGRTRDAGAAGARTAEPPGRRRPAAPPAPGPGAEATRAPGAPVARTARTDTPVPKDADVQGAYVFTKKKGGAPRSKPPMPPRPTKKR